MALPTLSLEKVTVQLGSEKILNGINVEIFAGEKVVLVGPSGQGKSVLLKTLAGLIRPNEGTFCCLGENFHSASAARRHELVRNMGMLFQKNALFDSLTCAENIAFPLQETTRLSVKEIEEKVQFFLNAVGLSHTYNLYPDEISGGMQKRLGIARALALNPKIIFYDDPTAGLDPITSRKIIDLIIDLQKQSQSTVVAVTNDMNRAYQLADRILMVVDKEVVITGNKKQTLEHKDPRIHQFVRGLLEGPLIGSNEVQGSAI